MPVLWVNVVDGMPGVLVEWAMEAVLCGSKAKDTASCSKLEAV